MTAAIACAEPIDDPSETCGLNFFDSDVDLRRLLWRRAPDLLERHEARLQDFGAWVGGPLDVIGFWAACRHRARARSGSSIHRTSGSGH